MYRVWEGLHVGGWLEIFLEALAHLLVHWKSIWCICALFDVSVHFLVRLCVFCHISALFGAPAHFLVSPHGPKVPGGSFEGQAGYKGVLVHILGSWKCFWRSWRLFGPLGASFDVLSHFLVCCRSFWGLSQKSLGCRLNRLLTIGWYSICFFGHRRGWNNCIKQHL